MLITNFLLYISKNKLHTNIHVNKDNLKKVANITKDINILRSTEIVTMAYEKGLLDKFLPELEKPRETLLDGLLWGVKLNGCSI